DTAGGGTGVLNDAGVLLNLFGDGAETAAVDLDTDDALDVNVDLLGTGGGMAGTGILLDDVVDDVDVSLLGDADRTLGADLDDGEDGLVADVDLLGGTGGAGGIIDGADVALDLFGPGDAGNGGSGAAPGTGSGSGPGDVADTGNGTGGGTG